MEIFKLKAEGMSIREIARTVGHSRNTVRKWLRAKTVKSSKPRSSRPSKLDPFKPYLRRRMGEGVFNANKLLREIKRQGYPGGRSILKDYVKPFRAPSESPAVVRFDTPPGEQAQVDFGTFDYQDKRGKHRVYAFVMLLGWSRAVYVEFVEKCDLGTLLSCHIHAFEAFGGVPRTILYDNLKAVVSGREGEKVLWNSRFADFALLSGFIPKACRPYRAQTKGKVERVIGYLRHDFWVGLKFTGLDDLNAQVAAWCSEVANRRIHGTTKARPCDLLASEGLGPVPDRAHVSMFLMEKRDVSRDAFVSYDGGRYGVPWQYAGKTVQVREIGPYVEIVDGPVRVALHNRIRPGGTAKLPGQWADLPLNTPRRPSHKGLAHLIPTPDVEARDLSVYDQLCGGGGL